MRTRTRLVAAAMGAAVLLGGATTAAQAIPVSAAASVAAPWIHVGSYKTDAACRADGQNSAQTWKCQYESHDGRYHLYVR
ncbi:hypothetical protein [Streptomyces sp. SID3343]|uniref:hypothetical protein n=1 Tax=Streptomyces sp. SID3343 TaxID=2690260 RepID=UPI00136C8133|nr:hypothetical protein [Streptomyces sp. SID3343]MYV99847.1 hypothetical protein [Streptomyces sp. SID3343]